jgi:GNAT superfamily N-acetyltransferase
MDAAVVALALHPFRELPSSPGFEKVEQDGLLFVFHPYPTAQLVEPVGLEASDVPSAVAAARSTARERGKRLLAWWIAPEAAGLGPALEREGLVNEDTPGFEAVETAMALVQPPAGGTAKGIAVTRVESYEDFAAVASVGMAAFEFPEAMRAEILADLPQRWSEFRQPGNPDRQYLARIGDEVVGCGGATFGDAGINLFGGAVLPHARGRGVYRALTTTRWEEAVQRGSPALTVQAGTMSMPILAKLGFSRVGEARVYVDDLGGAST